MEKAISKTIKKNEKAKEQKKAVSLRIMNKAFCIAKALKEERR
jgi:hypothetical protein